MSFDISTLSDNAQISQQALEDKIKTVDTNDMKGMIELQQEMAKMSNYYGTLSAVVSNLKNTAQSIIQKM